MWGNVELMQRGARFPTSAEEPNSDLGMDSLLGGFMLGVIWGQWKIRWKVPSRV